MDIYILALVNSILDFKNDKCSKHFKQKGKENQLDII